MKRRNELNMKPAAVIHMLLPSELQHWIIHQKPTRRRIGDGIAAPCGSSCGGGGCIHIYIYIYIYICIHIFIFLCTCVYMYIQTEYISSHVLAYV